MEFSIEKTISAVPLISKIKVFSDKKINLSRPYEFIDIGDQFSYPDYSAFLIKNLNEYIDTTHVLVTQYDGFGVNGKYWKDEYFEYDYIGSPTSFNYTPVKGLLDACDIIKTGWFVGGGGFSMRSKKLLQALQDSVITTEFYNKKDDNYWHSEDVSICIIYKDYLEKEHGIKFAPIELGIEFSAEYLTGYDACLGFHGYENIPFFLSEEECKFYLQNLKLTDKHKVNKLIGNMHHVGYTTLINSNLMQNRMYLPFSYN